MKIGFIGAGKMGFTLGRHFCDSGLDYVEVTGYYSRNLSSAREAAEFTDTKYYEALVDLVSDSDTLFVTVPDGQIAVMAEKLDRLGNMLDGKIVCHTSGALSSQVFSGMKQPVYGYSIHPIYAVNSRTESYKHFSDCFITIEGSEKHLQEMVRLFRELGHSVKVISADNKVKYHSGAVFASNLVIGLYRMAVELLTECGFSENEAEQALMPLFENNASNMVKSGCKGALTGPVARCDEETVSKHLEALSGDSRVVYGLLSEELVLLARENACGDSGKTEEEIIEINKQYDHLLGLLSRHL